MSPAGTEAVYVEDIGTIPAHLMESVVAYVATGRRTGDFLRAVLSDQLFDAMARADEVSRASLKELVTWIYCRAPSDCWGSSEAVDNWIKGGGWRGVHPDEALPEGVESARETLEAIGWWREGRHHG